MYKQQFKEWNVYKVIREQDVDDLARDIDLYRNLHKVCPDDITINGRKVSLARVQRSIKRHRRRLGLRKEASSSSSSTPSRSVRIVTPRSMVMSALPLSSQNDAGAMTTTNTCSGHRHRARTTEDGVNANSTKEEASKISPQFMIDAVTTLSVAILQTDGHLQDVRSRAVQDASSESLTSRPTWPMTFQQLDLRTFSECPYLNDLAKVIREFRIYHEYLHLSRGSRGWLSYKCLPSEAKQARDFYARSWIGSQLLERKCNEKAFEMFACVCDQISSIIKEQHPHFLPWMCFVICSREDGECVWSTIAGYVTRLTGRILPYNDPRCVIQNVLARSETPRQLAIVLLSLIIDDFRQRCSPQTVEALKLLAQLFDHVLNQEDQLTAEDVEPVLQQWARTSYGLAELVNHAEIESLPRSS